MAVKRWSVAIAFIALPALANQPPGPAISLPTLLILPVMMIITAAVTAVHSKHRPEYFRPLMIRPPYLCPLNIWVDGTRSPAIAQIATSRAPTMVGQRSYLYRLAA